MEVIVPLLAALGVAQLFLGLTAAPRARSRAIRRLDDLAAEAGWRGWTGTRLAGLSATLAALAATVVSGATGSGAVGLGLGAVAAYAPIALARGRRDRRRRRLRETWPDALSTLISAVRAGVSLPEACVDLAAKAPEGLRSGFAAFAGVYRSTGSFAAASTALRDELADPIADRVAIALAVARDVGGTDLVAVLRALQDFVRSDLRVRKEIEARWAWTVTAARLAAAAPWCVLALMATRPEAARAYATPTGTLVVGAGAAATILGYRLMMRAARLPDERRVLA